MLLASFGKQINYWFAQEMGTRHVGLLAHVSKNHSLKWFTHVH